MSESVNFKSKQRKFPLEQLNSHDGLIYHYCDGSDVVLHGHQFDLIMREAYEGGAAFSIPGEFRDQYSEQELSLLHKIAAKGPKT